MAFFEIKLHRVCLAILIGIVVTYTWNSVLWVRFGDPHLEFSVMGRIDAPGAGLFIVPLKGSCHVLAEAFSSYSGSGDRQTLIEYPILDLRFSSGVCSGLP